MFGVLVQANKFKRTTNLKENMQERSATTSRPTLSIITKMLSVAYSIAKPVNIYVESIDWASALSSAYAANLGVL